MQVPVAALVVQPGVSEQQDEPLHSEQLLINGVPVQVGPVVNTTPLVRGRRTTADLQHKRASGSEQSLLDLHCFSQVCWHTPSQQSEPFAFPMQSVDCVHAFGHGEYWGLRHSPLALSVESTFCTLVQQISPEPVLHSLLAEQALGHCEGGRQTGSL